MDTETEYRCFIRDWWTASPKHPSGRVPGPGPKTYIEGTFTFEEAREMCKEYNETHEPGYLSRKMEFEEA